MRTGRVVGAMPPASSAPVAGSIPPAEPVGGPFDVVFECVGVPGMIDRCVAAAAVHGRVIVTGVCTKPDPFVPVVAVVKELTMSFTVYYQQRHFAHTIAALHAGSIDPNLFITDRVDLDGFPAAFTALRRRPPSARCSSTRRSRRKP